MVSTYTDILDAGTGYLVQHRIIEKFRGVGLNAVCYNITNLILEDRRFAGIFKVISTISGG